MTECSKVHFIWTHAGWAHCSKLAAIHQVVIITLLLLSVIGVAWGRGYTVLLLAIAHAHAHSRM